MPTPINGSTTSVASSTTPVTILPAGRRTQFYIENDSTAVLYLLFTPGTVSATNRSVKLTAGQTFESIRGLFETGEITGVWAAENGAARVTSLVW